MDGLEVLLRVEVTVPVCVIVGVFDDVCVEDDVMDAVLDADPVPVPVDVGDCVAVFVGVDVCDGVTEVVMLAVVLEVIELVGVFDEDEVGDCSGAVFQATIRDRWLRANGWSAR